MKLTSPKLEGWGYRMVKFRNFNFNHFCRPMKHRLTDGQTGDSI